MSLRGVRWEVFVSPFFVAALFLLLVNDYVLKQAFGNWITGKVSDFAGLFVFVQFFSALFTTKTKAIALGSGIAFVYWKSPLSQPMIDRWNDLGVVTLARTVDATDLIALISIPFAYAHFHSIQKMAAPKVFAYSMALVSLIAITGTSIPPPSYFVKFEAPGGPFTSPESVYKIVDDVLSSYGFICSECNPKASHRIYHRESQRLHANFDSLDQVLFLTITGTKEKEVNETGKSLESAISIRLKSLHAHLVVLADRPQGLGESVASFSNRIPDAGWPIFCGVARTTPQMNDFAESLDRYAQANGYGNFVRFCPWGTMGLCRDYTVGRVIGPYDYSRSTIIEVRTVCRIWAMEVNITFRQYSQDKSVDTSRLVGEIKTLVEKTLQKN